MAPTIKSFTAMSILLCVSLMLFGCGNQQSEEENSKQVSLAMLAQNSATFDGVEVRTFGMVRNYEPPLHYWVEDEALHRVKIVPNQIVAPYLGQAVMVTGKFTVSAKGGRQITLTDIQREK